MYSIILSELKKGNIGDLIDIFLLILNMSMLIISCNLIICVKSISSGEWYKGVEEGMIEQGKAFVYEQSDMIVAVITIVCIIIWIAVGIVINITVKNTMKKHTSMNAMLQAMGYRKLQIYKMSFFNEVIFVIISIIPSYIIAALAWKGICINGAFKAIVSCSGVGTGIPLEVLITIPIIMILIIALLSFAVQRNEYKEKIVVRIKNS